MPVMNAYFDERGMPVLDLVVSPHGSRITALIDTGFDGEFLVYHDQLRAIGVDVVFDRAEQLRLADGSEVTLLGAALTIDWHGEPRRVNLDVVPTRAPHHARALLGCRLLRDSQLLIDFPAGTIRISR
jgi:predicted aspartyl protease